MARANKPAAKGAAKSTSKSKAPPPALPRRPGNKAKAKPPALASKKTSAKPSKPTPKRPAKAAAKSPAKPAPRLVQEMPVSTATPVAAAPKLQPPPPAALAPIPHELIVHRAREIWAARVQRANDALLNWLEAEAELRAAAASARENL